MTELLFKRGEKTQAFSLVEMLVVIAIHTLLFGAIIGSIVLLYKSNQANSAQAQEIDFARRGILVWVRDAREMTYAADGTFPLVTVEDHRFGFYSDIDRDAFVEYVEYRLQGTILTKKVYNPIGYPATYNLSSADETLTLSEYVQNIGQSQKTFKYYDETGTLVASPAASVSDIRYIEIQLIVNVDPVNSPGEFMLRGSAAPRNLKDNL